MRSSSPSEYLWRAILTPPLAPPNGTSTKAHLKVISAASAATSSPFTVMLNRMPPFVGSRWWLCSARHASITSMVPSSRLMGKLM